jgi:hypothetical protein
MMMHARGPGAGWSWLMGGFTVAKRHPWTIIGAAALFTLCMLVPMALQFLLQQWATSHGDAAMIVLLLASMLVFGALYPVLMGGFMRVIDANRNDRPMSAWMVLSPFRPGRGGLRIALFGLGMLLLYVAFLAGLLSTIGHGLLSWYLQLLDSQTLGAPPQALPPLPAGALASFALLTVFFLFYAGATAVGVGQASLRDQPLLAALRDGIAGAFKNALPLVVLAVCGVITLFVVAIAFGVLGVVPVLLGMLVSKPVGIMLFALLYIAMIILMYAFMMGVNHAMWHDVAEGGSQGVPLPNAEN